MNTKVNMDLKVYLEISRAATLLKTSHSNVIKQLFKYFERYHRKNISLYENVLYQQSSPSEDGKPIQWKQFHLSLNQIEYECFTDMRKFCKMSVSLIIAESVKLYLKILLNKKRNPDPKKQDMDKYPDILFPGYGMLWEKTKFGYKFTIYWGFPDKIPDYF